MNKLTLKGTKEVTTTKKQPEILLNPIEDQKSSQFSSFNKDSNNVQKQSITKEGTSVLQLKLIFSSWNFKTIGFIGGI